MRITLNGYVSSDEDKFIYDWFGFPAFCPGDVRNAIESIPEEEELTLEINSYGGSVWAGSEIYSVLRSAKNPTCAEIQSLAASAASYLALGCDRVLISPVAQMMIHPPSTLTEGDASEHKQSIKVLNAITESILNAYVAKSRGKKSRDELSRMMQSTSWLTAQEALDAGLVDEIMYKEEDGEFSPGSIVNALGIPDITKMRSEYYRAREKEKAGLAAEPESSWKETARLEIEKNRYV